MNTNNEKSDFALVRKPLGSVEKAASGSKRILSGMVADTLTLGRRTNQPRIVLVDDEPSYLDLLEDVIRNNLRDAVVLKFAEGEQAWLELLRMPPDFLITDLERPGKMNGWEMIPLLAERKIKCPIMLLSGSTKGQELHQKATLALNGKDDVLMSKILAGEFRDEDLQSQEPSDAVLNLIRNVSPPLNFAFLAKPFDPGNFIKFWKLV